MSEAYIREYSVHAGDSGLGTDSCGDDSGELGVYVSANYLPGVEYVAGVLSGRTKYSPITVGPEPDFRHM